MRYTGGCHCGAVRFEAEMEIAQVIACNCSICSKRGHLLAFTGAEHFRILKGEDALTDYQFAKKVIHHFFCKICGVGSFGRGINPKTGGEMAAINVRCLDEIDLDQIPVQHFDGKSL